MRITSWNVNSIGPRLERLLDWLDRRRPSVVGLQETKRTDEEFPRAEIEAAGYHVEAFGQKTYNGVALLTREPLEDVVRGLPDDGEDAQRRLIAGVAEGVKLVNVYVPNGQAVDSPKFAYKLDWLSRLGAFLSSWASPDEPLVLMGDFNIAPEARDVHDPEAYRGQVHFHPDEHAALAEIQAWGLQDLFREHEEGEGLYSWWDYRRLAFPQNHGLRIDLVLGTAPVQERCVGARIEREERKVNKSLADGKPSDHAPVTIWLDERDEA